MSESKNEVELLRDPRVSAMIKEMANDEATKTIMLGKFAWLKCEQATIDRCNLAEARLKVVEAKLAKHDLEGRKSDVKKIK